MKPNILYTEQSIKEGNIYFTEFTDYIKLLLEYKFNGIREADIKGNYEVIASVEGYTSEEKTGEVKSVKTIWKKDFLLFPKTNFETKEKTLSIKRDLSIKLEEYNTFAKEVIESSKVNIPVKLMVCMNIEINAGTDKGSIQEKLSSSIDLPLGINYFEIIKNEVEEKNGVIEEIQKVQIPLNKKMIYLYIVVISISVIALLFVIIFTSGTKVTDPFIKNLNRIFKKYGSRLVALNGEIAATYDKYCKVRSMDDLVRISDELGKLIMYEYSHDNKDITQFYIFEDKWMYMFDLGMVLEPSKDKESHIEHIDNIKIIDHNAKNTTLAP